MSTNNEWDEDDEYGNESDSNAPKALRAALRKEKEQRKLLEDQLSKIQRDLKQRTVGDVLTSKGVNPKLAKFVLADLDEVDEGSVGKWLDENSELFGVQPASGDNAINVGEVNEFQRAQAATGGSAPQPTADHLAAIKNATTKQELRDAMTAAGLT